MALESNKQSQKITYAIIDLETTGGNFQLDKIIEIAIIITDGERNIREYQTLVNPERPILPFISKLTGISNSMVKTAPTFKEIASEVYEFLQGHIFVAHNVRFDYGFIKSRLKHHGYRYRSKHVCTVELSKRVFKNLPSYSLGKLCKSLSIPMSNRHRAYGDTLATTLLFQKIWSEAIDVISSQIKTDEVIGTYLPPTFQIDLVDDIAEAKGVYTFYNESGQALYVSKTKNLRASILSHFDKPFDLQDKEMEKQVHSYQVEELPTDMTCQLVESQMSLLLQPKYSKVVRRLKHNYGLFLNKDRAGYLNADVLPLKKQGELPMLRFHSVRKAKKVSRQLYTRLQIDPNRKHILEPDKYNQILKDAIKKITYPYHHCWYIESHSHQDTSVVYIVKDYELIGFSVQKDVQYKDFEQVLSNVYTITETADLRKKFLQFVQRQNAKLRLIDLSDG